jgi:hypothetical protein
MEGGARGPAGEAPRVSTGGSTPSSPTSWEAGVMTTIQQWMRDEHCDWPEEDCARCQADAIVKAEDEAWRARRS